LRAVVIVEKSTPPEATESAVACSPSLPARALVTVDRSICEIGRFPVMLAALPVTLEGCEQVTLPESPAIITLGNVQVPVLDLSARALVTVERSTRALGTGAVLDSFPLKAVVMVEKSTPPKATEPACPLVLLLMVPAPRPEAGTALALATAPETFPPRM
jgi:hypothetical protein